MNLLVTPNPMPSLPKILVVEDNLSVRQTLTLLFTRYGYETMSAVDGLDALEIMKETSPDLILSDLMMPRMDGMALLRKLRSEPATREIPFMILTGKNSQDDYNEAMQLGVKDFLYKPFDIKELLAKVNSALE